MAPAACCWRELHWAKCSVRRNRTAGDWCRFVNCFPGKKILMCTCSISKPKAGFNSIHGDPTKKNSEFDDHEYWWDDSSAVYLTLICLFQCLHTKSASKQLYRGVQTERTRWHGAVIWCYDIMIKSYCYRFYFTKYWQFSSEATFCHFSQTIFLSTSIHWTKTT